MHGKWLLPMLSSFPSYSQGSLPMLQDTDLSVWGSSTQLSYKCLQFLFSRPGAKLRCQAKSSLLPNSVNNILLVHTYTHVFYVHSVTVPMIQWQSWVIAIHSTIIPLQSLKKLWSGPFYRKFHWPCLWLSVKVFLHFPLLPSNDSWSHWNSPIHPATIVPKSTP